MKHAVIVLPTYNEAQNIARLIHAIFAVTLPSGATDPRPTTHHAPRTTHLWQLQVLVVDSSSPDGTADIVRDLMQTYPPLSLIETKKEGLGRAYLSGMRYALEKLHADVIFEMDADFSHDPCEVPTFLKEIDHGADLVIGTRYAHGGSIPADWGLHRKIFSIGANLIVRLGFMRLRNTEWTGGYRAIRRHLVEAIIPHMTPHTGYVFQIAFLDRALNLGAKVVEIPIHFTDRVNGISKVNAPQQIVQTLMYVLTHSSFIKFAMIGVIGIFIDLGLFYLLWRVIGVPKHISNLISMELAVLSNYLLNNFWAFSYKRHTAMTKHLAAFVQFNLVALGSFAIQAGGIELGSRLWGDAYSLVYKTITIFTLVTPYSYVMYNKVVWRK